MSAASSDVEPVRSPVSWNPWWGVVFTVLIFYVSQLAAGLIVAVYPYTQHWSHHQTTTWLNNSTLAQFTYVLLAETAIIGALFWFLKMYRRGFGDIGLKRPRWRDPVYGLLATPVYYLLYLLTVGAATHLVPSLNVDQQQQIGFNDVHGALALTATFISLVILPALAEEIMVRGFLYSSLRKALRILPAALLTSLIFAAAHLPEGGAAGPLYIGALDTFILSLVLVYLREKTGSLWASITLHAIKNAVAFAALFVFRFS